MFRRTLSVLLAVIIAIGALALDTLSAAAVDRGDAALTGAIVKDFAGVGSIMTDSEGYLRSLGVDIPSLHDLLADSLAKCKTIVYVSKFEIPDDDNFMEGIYGYIRKAFPEYYYLVLDITKTVFIPDDYGHVESFALFYLKRTNTPNKVKNVLAAVASVVDTLTYGVKDNDKLTDAQKALVLHDRLAMHLDYEESSTEGHLAYGALLNNKAVCQGYTYAYEYIMNMVGIETYSVISDCLNHIWNIAFIDGVPYYIDVTWDDTGFIVTHENFLRSYSGIVDAGHFAEDFESEIKGVPINNTKYDDYYWTDIEAEFVLAGNKLYYIDYDKETLNKAGDKQTVIFDLSDDIGNSVICGIGDQLFLSYDAHVYRIDPVSDRVSTVPVTSLSELGADGLRGSVGDCEWELTGAEMHITGDGIVDEYFLCDENSPFYYYYLPYTVCVMIKSVTISDGVTGIDECVFSNWTGLESVSLPDSLTEIGEDAFSDCENLENIDIPDEVSYIGFGAFNWCLSLKGITIPDSVVIIGDCAFQNCPEVTSITLGSGLESVGYHAFLGSPYVKSITIPKSVTSIGDSAFGYDLFDNIDGFTIYGYKGTAAERYAAENDFKFVALKDSPPDPSPTPLRPPRPNRPDRRIPSEQDSWATLTPTAR